MQRFFVYAEFLQKMMPKNETGKLQEQEGPTVAREMLKSLNYEIVLLIG